jgi:hypothetical protein
MYSFILLFYYSCISQPQPSIFMYSCILLFYYSITPVFLTLNLNLNLTLNLLPPLPFYTPL